MFKGCEKIISIDFIIFNTQNITNMKYMFYECKNLKKISDLVPFDTKKVNNMSGLFNS